MRLYRISDCRYISDLSGKGAALNGGRWNSKNVYVVYTAESRALALLEAMVHIGKVKELGFCMATIDIPDEKVKIFPIAALPDDWQISPPADHLKIIGDNFIRSNRYLALRLPSVIMPEENNFLLNPAHDDFGNVSVIHTKKITLDQRLLKYQYPD